jgi:enoyl-CoA hydratase
MRAMPLVDYKTDRDVAVLTMDDGKANALSDAMIADLEAALARAEKEAKAIVLTGRPDRFCAGFDLKTMMSGPEAAGALLRRGAALYMTLYGSPLPLVIACTGHSLAGGALVLLTADMRVGAAGAYRIGLNEVSISLPTPVLAVELARARLATTELTRATLHAKIYDPESAVVAGFLDEVAPAGDILARAMEHAITLGAYSRQAFASSKSRLRRATIAYINSTLDEDMRAITAGT